MYFNSIDFAVFLPLVFVIYWFVCNASIKKQNIVILFASYIFYGWWDWRFLSLILFSTVVDYTLALKMEREKKSRNRVAFLWISILINIGLLGFFKYYNFFLDSLSQAFSFFGVEVSGTSLNILLPVGISFYTFQTLSYTIDVYRGKLHAARNFVSFAAYVSFFPQLVAGPIERATRLLPQFNRQRSFEYKRAVDGSRQILWGLFKKVVVADNCAQFADVIFNNSDTYSGSTLLLGAVFFSFQIYGDFSGYSDIAIGVAKLFGFDLMKNFKYPYFSRDIAEFWRRWHISLSTWFRDYLYFPLGGSRVSTAKTVRNTLIVFLVSGFWHGANWTFVAWGFLNFLYFLPMLLLDRNRNNLDIVASGSLLPNVKELFGMLLTYGLTVLAWIFFRAENIEHAYSIVREIFSASLLSFPKIGVGVNPATTIILVMVFMIVEWFGREKDFAFQLTDGSNPWVARCATLLLVLVTVLFMSTGQQEFIYFQF